MATWSQSRTSTTWRTLDSRGFSNDEAEADGARAYDAAAAAQNLHYPRNVPGDTSAEPAVKRRDNRSAIPDKGKSRFVGVSWSKQHKKWWKYE